MIPNGSEVKDLSSGISGIVINRVTTLAGMIRYGVQLQKSDGMADAYEIDEALLEVISPGISHRAIPCDPWPDLVVGTELEDKVTGFKGIAINKIEMLAGCVLFTLQPHGVDKEGKLKTTEIFNAVRLQPTAKPKKVAVKRTTTGGPTTLQSRKGNY